MQQVIIVCPFYNDEASFNIFAAQVEKEVQHLKNFEFSFLIINDGSAVKPALTSSLPIKIIHLNHNIGHQKAIAIGLSYAHQNLQFDKVVVMDCDGEDRPEDVATLLQVAHNSDKIVVAQRASRQEGKKFKAFYKIYKSLFNVLTGKKISFGNFMVLSRQQADQLVYRSEIWNHLAGGILKSNIPFSLAPTHRGKRYKGNSQMNFTALLLHGLSAIGVFIDIIATRLLLFSIGMILLSFLAILIVIGIKFFTPLAVPGWATTAVSSLLVVLLQSFLLSLFTIFLYLSASAQRKFIPAHHYNDYIRSIEK